MEIERFIQESFGFSAAVKKICAPAGLPFYMTVDRDFFQVVLAGIPFLLIELPPQDLFGAAALEKQLVKYMASCDMNAAYLISGVTKVQRDALTWRRIPFISLPDQIFLPFLGICLGNLFKTQKLIQAEHFTPASQCLYLYFLYHSNIQSLLKKRAAEALRLTGTSITRASKQLAAMGLILEESAGTEIRMIPAAAGRAYYELGRPYLISPVSRVITAAAGDVFSDCPAAGESALSALSMLNAPAIPVAAAGRKNPILSGVKELDEKWCSESSLIHLEIWKYPPELFSGNGHVDPVSLAASLEANTDERIQGELQTMLENIQW